MELQGLKVHLRSVASTRRLDKRRLSLGAMVKVKVMAMMMVMVMVRLSNVATSTLRQLTDNLTLEGSKFQGC